MLEAHPNIELVRGEAQVTAPDEVSVEGPDDSVRQLRAPRYFDGDGPAAGGDHDMDDWAEKIPNARYVNWNDPSLNLDFGVPVDGAEPVVVRAVSVRLPTPHAPPRGRCLAATPSSRTGPARQPDPRPHHAGDQVLVHLPACHLVEVAAGRSARP